LPAKAKSPLAGVAGGLGFLQLSMADQFRPWQSADMFIMW
jgi:hypothetical protein